MQKEKVCITGSARRRRRRFTGYYILVCLLLSGQYHGKSFYYDCMNNFVINQFYKNINFKQLKPLIGSFSISLSNKSYKLTPMIKSKKFFSSTTLKSYSPYTLFDSYESIISGVLNKLLINQQISITQAEQDKLKKYSRC